MTFTHQGRTVTVNMNFGHPENYLWILIDDRRFFLGVRTPGMTRGDVRRMAMQFMEARC